ncbi:MAG: efflux RND transporter permease subunit, partial [Candidatus Eisenbacteria bacterium]
MNRFFERMHGQRRAILCGLLALTVVGYALGLRLPAAILPEVTFPRIKVIAESGERSGDEMLREVTRPLETSLRRVPGLLEMRSITSRGSTEINLDCSWSSNMDLTLQRVQAQVAAVRDAMPTGTSIDARLMNPALFPVLGFSLVSPGHGLAELRDVATLQIQPELSRLPGVAEVVIQGGGQLEARVTLDPTALEAHGLDAKCVADALTKTSTLESVGLLESNRELYLGLADARPPNLEALANVPIPVPDGAPARLGTLGRIALEEAPQFTRYAAQSSEAVLVNVLRQPSASTIDVAREARRWFDEHRSVLPSDTRIQVFYDQSDLVRDSVTSVRDSLIVGAVLAVILIILFLGSWKLGWTALIVLPASVGLTLFGSSLSHQSLNLMTLGGVAAAVGLVLDDASVVVEHLSHRA